VATTSNPYIPLRLTAGPIRAPTSEYLSLKSDTMALTLPYSDVRLGYAAPLPTYTPAQLPHLAFRQSFKKGSWSSSTSAGPSWGPLPDARPLSSAEYAAMLQFQFDEEDRLLAAERSQLAATAQHVFDCGVCMDTLPEDSIARIDPCGHSFCRECVRSLIESQIESRRFPVLCPTCTADRTAGTEETGKVTRELVQEIGIAEAHYEIWVEMEMSEFFVRLHCRKCTNSSFFEREGMDEARNLRCPVTDCNFVWCKECQQEIVPDGPEHSCDGSSEMKHLVEQQGWKYCPSCKVPCEKISGCNFLSCISPGCNTHFCYKCCELIVKSAVPAEIGQGKAQHNAKCPL
jgi:isopentenyldiphosphate isomerase